MSNINLKNVKFLDELIDFMYGDKPYYFRAEKLKEMIDPANSGKGRIWEFICGKGMRGIANLLENNAPYRDMDDNTDMKFSTFTTWDSNRFEKYATIHIENKIGPLRVCLCYPGIDKHKVYFMFVPTEAHMGRDTDHPVKIKWGTKGPIGEWWEKYQCSFEEVLRPNPELNLPKKDIKEQVQFDFRNHLV